MFRVLAGFLRFETFTVFECFEYVEMLLSSELLLEILSLCCTGRRKIKFLRDKENFDSMVVLQKSTTVFHPLIFPFAAWKGVVKIVALVRQ